MSAARLATLLGGLLAALTISSSATATVLRAPPSPGPPTVRSAWVAHIVIRTPGLSAPGHGRLRATIATASSDGGPVALLVLDARVLTGGATWLRVLLPRRPNGTSVWIDADFVTLTRTSWRIDVSLRRRTVTLLEAGRAVDRWRAVIGKRTTPTPRGLFAIYERERQPSPAGFVGSWALPLSGFSDVLHRFDGGPGRFAIHGRGGVSLLDPLGTARSHGCIRVDNRAVDLLAARAGAGTPVQIG